MDAIEREVRLYRTVEGRIPFLDWIEALRDERAKQKIQARIARIRLGNLGNTRPVGEGVQELKIDYGPGYRVYFAQHGARILIILCGGDKSTQAADIKAAKDFWNQFKKEQRRANR